MKTTEPKEEITQIENKKEVLFTTKDILKLFIPLIIEQFLEFLVGLADSIMIAFVGENAVSGVSIVDFIMSLLISIFGALATGGAVIISQYLGKKQKEKGKEAANQLVWFSFIVGLVVMIVVYLIKPLILNVLYSSITNEVRQEANIYFIIVTSAIPFIALYSAGAALFRIMGNSKLPMKVMFIMNIVNFVGDLILIVGLGYGTAANGITTLIARVGAGIIVIALLFNQKRELYIEKTVKHKFDWQMIKKILRIGVPYGLENGLFYLGRILVLTIVSMFGTAAIAANSVSGSIISFQNLPGLAIGMGLTVIIAKCVGAGDYKQARFYTKKVMGMVYIAHFVCSAIILAILPPILKIYNLSPEANTYVYQIAWLHAIFVITFWIPAYTLPVVFRASGDAKFPMIVGTISMFLCRIVLAYIISVNLGFGMMGTWYAMCVDWIIKAIIFTIRYIKGKWTKYQIV